MFIPKNKSKIKKLGTYIAFLEGIMSKCIMKKSETLAILTALVLLGGMVLNTAWAAVEFVKPQDAIEQINDSDATKEKVAIADHEKSKARAPEPTTMALFGGGFLGVIASFIRKAYVGAKRLFDVGAALVGFIILSPLLILTALLVCLTSRGPIIYMQERVGKDGKNFNMYKFRTMKVDAEKNTGPVWAQSNDDRLIPIGKLLRKAHIDELPQLWNILIGEMSLIGPRPERPIFVEKFKEEIIGYEKRLRVKPGLTGLAQVWHRYDETFADVKKKLKYDLLYIRKMNFWADLGIIMRTFRVVLTGEGAK